MRSSGSTPPADAPTVTISCIWQPRASHSGSTLAGSRRKTDAIPIRTGPSTETQLASLRTILKLQGTTRESQVRTYIVGIHLSLRKSPGTEHESIRRTGTYAATVELSSGSRAPNFPKRGGRELRNKFGKDRKPSDEGGGFTD